MIQRAPVVVRLRACLLGSLLGWLPLMTAAAPPVGDTPPTGPLLKGNWYATEVIVFERPQVGTTIRGEQLLTDAPRTFPARLQSFDPTGAAGLVVYPTDPDDPLCRRAPPGSGAPRGQSAAPPAFAKPFLPPAPNPEPAAQAIAVPAAPAGTDPMASAAAIPPAPDPLAELQRALDEYEADLEAQSLAWLPPTANQLSGEARRLADGGYRILMHRSWLQNVAARGATPAILIQAGPDVGGTPALEGTVRLGPNRGLRFAAHLWYRDGTADGVATPDPAMGPATAAIQYFELREERRLGDGQLHYLDHPKLGVIVRATVVPVSAELREAWQALNPSAQSAPAAVAPPGASLPR